MAPSCGPILNLPSLADSGGCRSAFRADGDHRFRGHADQRFRADGDQLFRREADHFQALPGKVIGIVKIISKAVFTKHAGQFGGDLRLHWKRRRIVGCRKKVARAQVEGTDLRFARTGLSQRQIAQKLLYRSSDRF